ncbi:uncharacterized protein MONOS_7433 [Monocercomonoides exilis]|uniref:uncharacterized protein n=1 Tax=Monocercomonoides exilis TaxID=2049356 RepID=UPI0035594E88|nr:hypothetical protein MONOS_7433 [Monocercomonoides exilis]|eukprot:MONOS_7433.1-p1 / transcript=MONOS_7433.1 / gene=MONOS_7433 / organism=Monocercomonoides_exilis_PA203 / gene_product=unspecified product / transcript_product=unspecified product / location=Mono_scaffold00254:1164-14702(-) / protein_length=4273 / sequence_SO=supercontig / SO=protein_coding / is_pseudo=false
MCFIALSIAALALEMCLQDEGGGESKVVICECLIVVLDDISPFYFDGSRGLFTNISLRSYSTSTSTSTEEIFSPFFSSKASEGEIPEKCHLSVCSSHFSSFCVSSAPFISSHFVSLSQLEFFNISTNPSKTTHLGEGLRETSFLMSGCTFSSVWDVYDGSIVPSLNSPSSSLAASNTSFVRCYRSQNVAVNGSEGNPSKPGRTQIADNMVNSFTWCEWSGSRTTGTSHFADDGDSNGGAIYMYELSLGTLSVKCCSFNECYAFNFGGGIMCYKIKSIKIENNSFISCAALTDEGGGMFAYSISTCAIISGCEFHKCSANYDGGGLYLDYFNVSGSNCIGTESGKGESACVFECSFTSCSLSRNCGGGMYCASVPAAFKMRSVQFISCKATSYGGGIDFRPVQSEAPSNNIYCYFFFFHNCRCSNSTPCGHDAFFHDGNNLFSLSNPFYESYTTNIYEKRMCYLENSYQETQKKWWLRDWMKDLYVGVSGSDLSDMCGMSDAAPCKTVRHAVGSSMAQLSSMITLLDGKHVSKGSTIGFGEKKISIVGRGKTVSVIGTNPLSSTSTVLFSVSSGQLDVRHIGIDHNATRSSSTSVFVVSLESGILLLEDVAIDSSTSGGSVKSSSVFEVALNQLKTIDVEIKNIKMSQPLFAEPSSAGTLSGESLLGNLTIRNVNRTTGDGVVITKSVKGGETFVIWNTTMEGCFCESGNGGGVKVELASSTSKVRIGTSTSHNGGTTKFNKTKCSGYGGGVMLWLADNSFDFAITTVSFVGCSATSGGKDVFVNGSRFVSGTITTTKLNVENNGSIYDELMGCDRNEGGMGIFPLNVLFDTFSGAAHVGKAVNGFGGYDSWFCGFGYFPCKTITKAAENRFSSSKKNIVLDSGFELGEVVSMAGSYEWEVYCTTNKTNVNILLPIGMTPSYLINIESKSSIKNIAFQIPFSLSSATSLIALTSSSLTLTDCSVAHISESTSSVAFGYSIVNVQSGSLKMDRFVIGGALVFRAHSAIEFYEGMTSVICSGCNISGVKRNEGDGGWMKGTVGDYGIVGVDGCNVNGCSCVCGKGGGTYVYLQGNGEVVVNGSSVIDGCKSENNGGNGGRGGGMMVVMESGGCGLTIGQNVEFSKVNGNVALYGKDVFVHCGSGVFLESKVNTSSFSFFDISTIPSDVLKSSGSENGEESGVIPLFVYLCTMGTKVLVDGSGGNGKDHNHCGFDAFRCLTVDYCANSRLSESSKEIEIVSSSSITKEITGPSFGVIISGRTTTSSEGEKIQVNVSDGGSAAQDWLVGCSSSLTMSRLSFVVKGQLNSRRSAFIHSTSTLSVTNCSVSFESGALTSGKIGYSIIDMAGGNLIVDGFVMESGVTLKMNGKSPITMTSGVQLEISNSRMCGVEVEVAGGNGGGGWLNVGMGVNGVANIEECNLSSVCSGGSGMKGGGMMVSVGKGGSLEMKNVNLSGCEVPTEDIDEVGRGIGGGMFVELPEEIGLFVLEGMEFEGCNAWKGKNLFVEAQDMPAVINNTSIGFNPEIGIKVADLNELCGRERNQTEMIVPLVVFLRTIPSPAYVSGREQGNEFSLCGYEDYPCKVIGNVGEVQFPSSKRFIRFTSTFSFDEEVKLNEQSYEIDSSDKTFGIKIEATETKMQEALVMNSVSSTLTGILFELGGSIGEHSSFVHSSGGIFRFTDCGIKMGNGVDSANYEFVSASGWTLSISDFSMSHAKFGLKPFVVVDGNGEASIGDTLLESVENTNMKGLIEYSSSSSSLTIGNVTAQECVMGRKGLICDENGKRLGMRNCTIEKMSSLEGNGSVVSGEVGNGCAVEVNDVVIERCGTLKGCGGGMSVILKGTGEMRLGKSGVVTSFKKCSAGGEGSVGGYGGGVLLKCEEGGRDFVMSGLTFGTGDGVNTAAHGGNNVFVEGTNLSQLVNNASFSFSFEIEGERFDIKDLMGVENENELKLIPVVVFFREKPSVGYVNGGNGGMDYYKCGYSDFACSTLTYAGTSVFGTSPATLKLVDGSSIFDEMTLNTQEMNIDGDIEKAKIGISEGGENIFLIKSERAVSFSSLAFSISTFAESKKECVFLCSSSTLRFEGCSFGAESESIGVGLICGKRGKVELANCEFENIRMTKLGMVTFDGVGVGGLIDEVIVRNVTREYEGRSLFELRNGGDVEIKNTTMNKSRFNDGNEIEIGEGINAKIWNCTFKSIQRENGNGGVLNGRVGSGKYVDINKCVFEDCKCESTSAIGGGIFMIVGDGGNLLFDDNKMNGCQVQLDRSGKGGGLHLTFETTNIEYSMKNDDFANNVAQKGEDVYLVCGSPWTILLPALWEGTATRITAENKMWIFESSEPRKEDSLINYLFPRLGTNLFVSNAGNEEDNCGVKENPCLSVDIGFDRLKDEIERIMLVDAALVSKTINRGGKGLTIEGNEETRELIVEEEGKFELTEGDGQTHLTLSLLQISLPCSSASTPGDESIVEVRIGECFILDCLFSGGEGNGNANENVNECGKWIVIGNGGVIRIERTEMNGIRFEGCGIARFGGGNVIFESCSLSGIETSGGGVMVGNGGSEVTLRNMTALGCVVGAGSLMTSNGGSNLRVDGESRFENIETGSVSGGCVKSEMKLNDLLEMGSSSILRCSANGNGGRGGGIYLDLSDNCVNNFALTILIFEDNVAAEGRDLFISCKKLNETVMKERFGFEYKNENGEGEWMAVDMKGIDRDYFAESVDLGLFLVEVKRMEVCVSREGYDTLGCGSEAYPCESMWSGISHVDRSGIEGERKVKVRDEGTIEDSYSFLKVLVIDGCVNEGDETKHKPVQFIERIKGNSALTSSVISSTVSLSLLSLKLQIPSQFEQCMNSLISSNGVLKFENCLFEIRSSTDIVQYSLIITTSGSCTLKGCSLTGMSFVKSPLVMASSVLFENSSFSNIMNTGSGEEGGVAKVILKGNEDLVIKSTNASFCSLSSSNGKGGFLYLDCQNCLNEKPFLFDAGATFENNKAAIGKNVFILGKDFNCSVTNGAHSNKDLFMFLIPFSSFEIFISLSGFDVARCGSEEEPCQTMWKGMENMKKENGMKTIQIEGSTIIRDSFNVSNYQIKKNVKMGEEDTQAILNFEKEIGSQLEYFIENDEHLELTNIQLQLASDFDSSAKSIISNKGGDLVITGCSFHSAAGVNNGFDCVFVDVIGGSVEVDDLSMESCNIGNRVKKSINGASILESKSAKKICLVVNESSFVEDKAEASEKGGAISFTLGASGSMKMTDSTISHCRCGESTGRGGGMYLATKERGELNFAFIGIKFAANTARVGNNIFIECYNITSQINESRFQFDLREGHYSRYNAIYGRDECDYRNDTDLIYFVTIHQSDTIIVSSVNGSDERQCGTNAQPCYSIDYGLMHLTSDFMSQMIVVDESIISGELNLKEMGLSSKNRVVCKVEVETGIESTRDALITTNGEVSLLRVNFAFDSNFISSHESLISPDGGIFEIMNCSFTSKQLMEEGNAEFAYIPFHIINMEKGELQLMECSISNLILHESALHLSSPLPSVIYSFIICNSTISRSFVEIIECGKLSMEKLNIENITVEGDEESLISCLSMRKTIQLANCTIGKVSSNTTKGKLMKLEDCTDVKMDSCIFDGSAKERNEQHLNEKEEMCRWEGSLVDIVKSSMMMKVSTLSNSPEGGITMRGGNVIIEKGEFIDNNPSIEVYPSLRRNIICSDSGTLNMMSLKGGDGLKDNTSLWMLNEGCSFEGIVSERDSPFFIPVLESVEAKEETDRMKLTFKGFLFVPCNLSFRVVKRKGEEKEIEKHDFDSNGFLSEREAEGSVEKDLISNCNDEIEISAYSNGNERIVEGGKEGKSYWLLIVIVLVVILLIVFVVSVVLAVRWRKAKNENKDLREIVNDNIKKDPKAFEMVTMEMSPEEQWRRAERDAEKKNEERIKKKIYETNMEHSESSEHLLSECGSTENILGRDSDKIPEWVLEEVDEKEWEDEIRKRTPTPSISSKSTSSTTDTETTFVQIEDICPTTSSMSNLVDAMACSSPHEKLIVDLRDSLFMLLHGKNEKKEMAIGTFQEREQTAAQILFWVANLALHSFDEMNNPLQSLANLSPHIVLFSEHMVICIVMHSDFSSDDSSDSSSISSSTVVTSASDDDEDEDSLPSSAFEDDEYNRKECLRWKAPELLMNKKMGATKESVAFSIGMMLWECLTLHVPFGEYEAVTAGDKIVNGKRPSMEEVHSTFEGIVKSSFSAEPSDRPSLTDLKREFIQRFPSSSAMITMSDAIDVTCLKTSQYIINKSGRIVILEPDS